VSGAEGPRRRNETITTYSNSFCCPHVGGPLDRNRGLLDLPSGMSLKLLSAQHHRAEPRVSALQCCAI